MPASYSLPELVEKEIDALVKVGYYTSKSDVVKDALRYMLEKRTNLRVAAAIELYRANEVSLGKAAELADMSLIEFKEALSNRGEYIRVKASRRDMKKADELVKKLG